jgi:hypothetical protein
MVAGSNPAGIANDFKRFNELSRFRIASNLRQGSASGNNATPCSLEVTWEAASMITGSVVQTLKVWDLLVEVSIHQSTKSAWVAVGHYMDVRIEVKGRSASAALAGWRKAAELKGS